LAGQKTIIAVLHCENIERKKNDFKPGNQRDPLLSAFKRGMS
jgi:hypothetical protein